MKVFDIPGKTLLQGAKTDVGRFTDIICSEITTLLILVEVFKGFTRDLPVMEGITPGTPTLLLVLLVSFYFFFFFKSKNRTPLPFGDFSKFFL